MMEWKRQILLHVNVHYYLDVWFQKIDRNTNENFSFRFPCHFFSTIYRRKLLLIMFRSILWKSYIQIKTYIYMQNYLPFVQTHCVYCFFCCSLFSIRNFNACTLFTKSYIAVRAWIIACVCAYMNREYNKRTENNKKYTHICISSQSEWKRKVAFVSEYTLFLNVHNFRKPMNTNTNKENYSIMCDFQIFWE